MAYRIKGLFTKKERESLESFSRNYDSLVNAEGIDCATKEIAEVVFYPVCLLARCALYADDMKILGRIIGAK